MLDPTFVRDHLDAVTAAMANRGKDVTAELQTFAAAEANRRRLIQESENLKREQNASGEQVARAKKLGEDASHLFEASKQRGQKIKQLDVELESVENETRTASTTTTWATWTCFGCDRAGEVPK